MEKEESSNLSELKRKQSDFEKKNFFEEIYGIKDTSKKEPLKYLKWIIVFLVLIGLVSLLFIFELI